MLGVAPISWSSVQHMLISAPAQFRTAFLGGARDRVSDARCQIAKYATYNGGCIAPECAPISFIRWLVWLSRS